MTLQTFITCLVYLESLRSILRSSPSYSSVYDSTGSAVFRLPVSCGHKARRRTSQCSSATCEMSVQYAWLMRCMHRYSGSTASSWKTRKLHPTLSASASRHFDPSIAKAIDRILISATLPLRRVPDTVETPISDAYTNTTAAAIGTRPGPVRCMPLGAVGRHGAQGPQLPLSDGCMLCNVHASHKAACMSGAAARTYCVTTAYTRHTSAVPARALVFQSTTVDGSMS